jgi:Asp-tRNA(Asn)/Glu-tRNA(Gln) amidotransferase C subunit
LPRRKPAETKGVDAHLVERLAGLARLSLDPHEAEKLQGELSSILEYFAALDSVVDLSKTKRDSREEEGWPGGGGTSSSGSSQVDAATGGMRDDQPVPCTAEPILEGVPQRKGRYVRAPRVF